MRKLSLLSLLGFLPLSPAACGGTTTPDDGNTVMAGFDATLRAGPFTIPAGGDLTYCTFVRGDNAEAQDVKVLHAEQSAGGHHIIVYSVNHPINLGPRLCPQGGQFGWSQLAVSQDPTVDVSFPEGVGLHIKAHQQYVVETHYINASPSAIEVRGSLSVVYAPAGSVTQRAAPYLIGSTNIDLKPGADLTVEATCSPPDSISLLRMFGHEHRYGTGVTVSASSSGGPAREVYRTTEWESPPPVLFDPVMPLTPADSLHVKCDWKNTGDQELTYPKEMCLSVGMYYPAQGALVCLNGGRRDGCGCFYQGTFDSGPGGSTVQVSLARLEGIQGVVGDPAAGRPAYCTLWRAEDWVGTGPRGGALPYYYGYVEDTPLKDGQASALLTYDDVTPGDYRVFCWMDTIAGGLQPGTGDPVTLIPAKVTAEAGKTAEVQVTLDFAAP